jgi:hypothetical protein
MSEDTNELLWQQDDVAPSHPEDFAYELGWVALGETLGDDDGCEAARAMGEAIVGCEEMQAIKAVLRHLAVRQATEVQATVDVLRLLGLPDIAIEWVLSRSAAVGEPTRADGDGVADMNARRIMCGDLVVTSDGWTGRVVAQHGPYSWVSMQATNSPQTWGTSTLKPR